MPPPRARGVTVLLVPVVLALLWSAAMLVVGIAWSLGAPGYPTAPPGFDVQTPLELVPAAIGAPIVAIVAGIGVLVAGWLLAGARADARGEAALLSPVVPAVYAAALTVTATVAVVDARLMAWVGYVLSLGFPPMPPGTLEQVVAVVGALLWIAAAASWARRSRLLRASASAGAAPRSRVTNGRPVSASARIATWVAVVIPLLYAATRLLWAAGIPLGISEELLREGQESGLWWRGSGLALVAIGGAALTSGLVFRWGEVLPRWVPVLGGRSVPVLLAVVPGLAVSLIVFGAGFSFVRIVAAGDLPLPEHLVTVGPQLLWPIWGVALAVATVAYHRRRTGRGPADESSSTGRSAKEQPTPTRRSWHPSMTARPSVEAEAQLTQQPR
ncbi:hypothetical protein [Agromyces sp. Marseille-P2726]|uniref:hypothetical protein n=1 Tax=Agromyces sp. Marseille-P2726 TaxID=2709132 RepID=UPI00156FBD8F|nr:hypothetical protein [Agromyces sp. Marseille-P2726]